MILDIKKFLFILLILLPIIHANEINNINIDSLLKDIKNKTDLSEETRLENSGISNIFTRNDIDRMQARYLKDILKSNSTFGYNENRHGVSDPLTNGTSIPFSSSIIRVFIDDQEITGGMFGSGLFTHGNIDLGFVDHIEIYMQSPTYEYSTESTFMLIKLYSRSVAKDGGSKIELNIGSYGATAIKGSNAIELNDEWSLFSYITLDNMKREKYNSYSTELSRDKKIAHIFTTLTTQNHSLMVDTLLSKADAFAGISTDATPTENRLNTSSVHIGYNGKLNNFSFLATYDYLKTEEVYKDDVTPISTFPFYGMYPIATLDATSKSQTITAEIKYNYITLNNRLIAGIKYRDKKYNFTKHEINGNSLPDRENNAQVHASVFLQNTYSIKDNLLLTTGIQYVNVKSEDSKYSENENLLMYRFGMTYLQNNWIFKTITAHTEKVIEPYLIDSRSVVNKKINNGKSDFIYEDIIYRNSKSRYELVFGYMLEHNYLLPDTTSGKLTTYDNISLISTLARWEYKYNNYDKLFTEFSFQQVNNLPIENIKRYRIYKAIVRNLNTYKKFDIFNEVIFDRNNVSKENFYDYSTGVKYHKNEDLTFSFKVENLLHRAVEMTHYRVNTLTFTQEKPLNISPIDRKITLSMEYLF